MKTAMMSRPALYIVFFCAFATSLKAQESIIDKKITIEFSDNTIVEALDMISRLHEARFTYSRDYLPEKRITMRFSNERIGRILERILSGTGLGFALQKDRIVIYPLRQEELSQLPPPPRFTLSGYVRDAGTGEELIGSAVFVDELSAGTTTNAYGFYSLTLPDGRYHVQVSYLGYERKDTLLSLDRSRQVNIDMKPSVQELQQVIVTFSKEDQVKAAGGVEAAAMSAAEINELPALFGEQDVMQAVELLPGVLSTGATGGDISVRGSASDQNLILLDEAPVYNISHLLGIFSVFNTDALKHVSLFKDAIPTEYHGRLASVLDIRMDEGSDKGFGLSGGIGLIASRLKMEGKIDGGNGSYMIAGRRTYLDLLIKAALGDLTSRNGLFFSDLNGKANYRLGEKNRLFLSGYLGRDVLRFNASNDINWGNSTATLRWNHLSSDKLFVNTSFIFSDYQFSSLTNLASALEDSEENNFSIQTRIKDLLLKTQFQYYPDPRHTFKFGGGISFHQFVPAKVTEEQNPDLLRETDRRNALAANAFATHNWQVNDRLSLNYGLHLSNFAVLGTGDYVYTYDEQGNRADSTYFSNGKLIRNYFRPEPRLAATWLAGKRSRLTASYSRTHQYVQRISSAFANNPANIWLPGSRRIKPQRADQWSLTFSNEFGKKNFEFSVGAYFKKMARQINFRDGAILGFIPRDVESLLVFGEVEAAGLEWLLRKKEGRFRGWLSYTLSSSKGRFPDIDEGRPFPTEFDRTHDLAVIAIYDTGRKSTLAAKWIYTTGLPVTLPAGKYRIGDQVIDYYDGRNSYRLDDHHRLDLSLTLFRGGKRDRQASWNFAVYNFFGRRNPTFVYINNLDDETKSEVSQVSFFTFVPSITYNFVIK